jgi:hypothetical protein
MSHEVEMVDIAGYAAKFRKYPPPVYLWNGKPQGGWIWIGNQHQGSGYYGSYPHGYLDRMYALFPRTPRLHLFAGSVKVDTYDISVDVNPEVNPTVVCDIMDLSRHFKPSTFPIVFADPPYSKEEAARYGVDLPNLRLALREIRKVTQPGGLLVWLCTRPPIWRSTDWKLILTIGLWLGSNRNVRAVVVWEAQ